MKRAFAMIADQITQDQIMGGVIGYLSGNLERQYSLPAAPLFLSRRQIEFEARSQSVAVDHPTGRPELEWSGAHRFDARPSR